MPRRKFYLNTIGCLILGGLFFAGAANARILGPHMITAQGVVTGIDLQEELIVIDGQTYYLDDNLIVLNRLHSQSIRIMDKVEITYQKTDSHDKLIYLKKQSDTYQ
jgi:hypothetical protein